MATRADVAHVATGAAGPPSIVVTMAELALVATVVANRQAMEAGGHPAWYMSAVRAVVTAVARHTAPAATAVARHTAPAAQMICAMAGHAAVGSIVQDLGTVQLGRNPVGGMSARTVVAGVARHAAGATGQIGAVAGETIVRAAGRHLGAVTGRVVPTGGVTAGTVVAGVAGNTTPTTGKVGAVTGGAIIRAA